MKPTIKDLGETFCNMDDNQMVIDGFVIHTDCGEIFSKELGIKLHSPNDDDHHEYGFKLYID